MIWHEIRGHGILVIAEQDYDLTDWDHTVKEAGLEDAWLSPDTSFTTETGRFIWWVETT